MRKTLAMVALAVVTALSSPAVDKTPAPNPPAVVNPAIDALFTITRADCTKQCFLVDRSCQLNCGAGGDPTCEARCTSALHACQQRCAALP